MSTSETKPTDTTTRRRIRVTISRDSMKALVVIKKPEPGEPEISVEEIMEALSLASVTYGIDEAIVDDSVSQMDYEKPIEVAQGEPPVKGTDSKFEYSFQTENRFQPQEGKDGRIDYRDMKYIQNINEGGVLARKTPPTDGVNGTGVNGREIVAPRAVGHANDGI